MPALPPGKTTSRDSRRRNVFLKTRFADSRRRTEEIDKKSTAILNYEGVSFFRSKAIKKLGLIQFRQRYVDALRAVGINGSKRRTPILELGNRTAEIAYAIRMLQSKKYLFAWQRVRAYKKVVALKGAHTILLNEMNRLLGDNADAFWEFLKEGAQEPE